MTYVAAHVLGLILLLLLFYVTGRLVGRVTRTLEDVGERTGLIHIAIGITTWMYLLMALACIGLYRRGVLLGAAAAIGTAGVVSQRSWFDKLTMSGKRKARPERGWLAALAWLPPAIVLAQIAVRTLGPWLGWDDQSAHLTLPRIWLAHGGFLHLPFNVYSHWPSNIQML